MSASPRPRSRVPLRPGVLFHAGIGPQRVVDYQDHLLTILNYGTKVAGLLILPAPWVPPFAALPAWLSEEWQLDSSNWIRAARHQGIDVFGVFNAVSECGQRDVILRSSAVGEGLEDRGQYRSTIIRKGASEKQLLSAIELIYSDLDVRGRHTRMGVCVQRYFAPDFAGHVSNEVHLSATRNQWKYDIEIPSYAPNKGLNSKFAPAPSEAEALTVKGQRDLQSALRRACHWINLRVDGRSHIEWSAADGVLWIVQLDQESPTSAGENPHIMPPTHFGEPVSAPKNFTCFRKHQIQLDTPWKKLNNIRDFWISADPPKHRLYFATGKKIKAALENRTDRKLLAQEIDHLTSSRAVIRTDCRDPKMKSFNLPRTHTITGKEATRWLSKTISEMESRGAKSGDMTFILHQYIPARAAAWSYYSPGDALVRIDCLWGLPDGLQFLSHDTFELDARSGEELAAEVRFKGNFLQEQADGSWEYVPVARQFGRDRVLSKEALRTIALQTVAVSNRVGERAQIMWFCDLPSELGLGAHLPWYRSRDYSTHSRVERPPYRPKQVRTLEDLAALDAVEGRFILVVQPTAALVRADEIFLDRIIGLARQKNVPVELAGSVLGHAYYRLRDAGVMVVTSQPKYPRTRGKTAHRKLVRDAIPANIAAGGERVSFGRLAREEAVTALVGKLFEEGLEVGGASNPADRLEELADVLEVLRGLLSIEGVGWDQLIRAADNKRAKRGGFDQQTVLLETAKPKRANEVSGDAAVDLEPLVSLHKIGLISLKDGQLVVPFTRLIGADGIEAEVPFENGHVLVRVNLIGGGVTVRVRQPANEEVYAELQASLFDAE